MRGPSAVAGRNGLSLRASVCALLSTVVWASVVLAPPVILRAQHPPFPPSTGCYSCHNNLKTAKGQDVSIGWAWRLSLMANSARDPYWQASVRRVRRSTTPPLLPQGENEVRHMRTCPCSISSTNPSAREGTAVFLSPAPGRRSQRRSLLQMTCPDSCHQADPRELGHARILQGSLAVAGVGRQPRPLFGPCRAAEARATSIAPSPSGLTLTQSDHLRKADLCGSCHTLYTTTSTSPKARQAASPDADAVP